MTPDDNKGLCRNRDTVPWPALKVVAEEAVTGANERRRKRTDSREDNDRGDGGSEDDDDDNGNRGLMGQ